MPSKKKFHVIIPTHSAHDTLSHAVESALNQSMPAYKVTIIGDGVSEGVRELASDLSRLYETVEFLDYPKLKNRGEKYRDDLIKVSDADFITYLCDDDLLMPNHIEVMASYLEHYDFVHPRPTFVKPDGSMRFFPSGIEVPRVKSWHRLDPPQNTISLTGASHTRESYLKLKTGWTAGPEHIWTDLYMWVKFFENPEIKVFTVPQTTTIKLLHTKRQRNSLGRAQTTGEWLRVISDSKKLLELQTVIESTYKENNFSNHLRVSLIESILDLLIPVKRFLRQVIYWAKSKR